MAPFVGDVPWCRATTFVIFMIGSATARGAADFAIGGGARTYPLSGVLEVESGYDVGLWGAASSPFSGYARARLDLASSFTYNSVGGAFELFPLSFLGARAGGEGIQNDYKYTAYDCDTYACVGRYYRTYIEAELSLGAGPVFAQGRWRRERWTTNASSAEDFIEPTSGLNLSPRGASETVDHGIAGIKLNERWSVLGIWRYAESDQRGSRSTFPYGALRYQNNGFTVGVGAGTFESSLKSADFSFVGYVRWELSPKRSL